jgi:hypothetical protein
VDVADQGAVARRTRERVLHTPLWVTGPACQEDMKES